MKINKTLILGLTLCFTWQLTAQEVSTTVSSEISSREEAFIDAQRDIYIGRSDKALEKYEALYKADRSDAAVAFELAKLYGAKKDFLQFEKYVTTIAAHAPKNAAMLEYTTNIFIENGKFIQAEKGLNELILLTPNNKDHYTNLGKLYLKLGKKAEVLGLLAKQDLKFGKSYETSKKRYELYIANNDFNKALEELKYLSHIRPNDKEPYKETASHYIKNGDHDKAMEMYGKVLAIDPEDVEANVAILAKGASKDKPNSYLQTLLPLISNTTIDIDPKIKELTSFVINLANGGNQEVKTTLEDLAHTLIQAHPTEAKAYAISGDILMLNGKTEEAILKYEKTLSINNKVFAVWEQLMYGYLAQNRYDDLYKLSNKAIDIHPNEALNYFFASIGASHKNLYAEAISLAEEGIIVSGGNVTSTVRLKTALAKAYLGQKNLAAAQTNVEEAIQKSNNKYAYAYEVLGYLLEAKSDMPKAKEAWKKSIELGNKNKGLAAKIL